MDSECKHTSTFTHFEGGKRVHILCVICGQILIGQEGKQNERRSRGVIKEASKA